MKKLTLFEPAMCCSTGVCGPSVDENLIRITAHMQEIKKVEGRMMVRYNLAQNPNAFVRNQKVNELLQGKGVDCLPVTMVDDQIVKIGKYPSKEEIESYLEVSLETTVNRTTKFSSEKGR